MQLAIAGQAIIKHITIRAEYHGEERELAVDVKLILTADLNALANFAPPLKSLLYENADDAERRLLRLPQLKPLGLTLEFENHSLRIGEQIWDGVRLHKLELAPEADGRVLVTMIATLSQIDPAMLPALAALWLAETQDVEIEPLQAELFSMPTGNELLSLPTGKAAA